MELTNQILEQIRHHTTAILSGRTVADKINNSLSELQSLPEYKVSIRIGDEEYTIPRSHHAEIRNTLSSMRDAVLSQNKECEQ